MATKSNNIVLVRKLLLLSLTQKRFLTSSLTAPLSPNTSPPSTAVPPPPSFTVQFLINSCGLSSKSALSASRKLLLDQNNIQNPQSVLQFLKGYNFNQTHVAALLAKRPDLLHCRVEDTLKPKFDFFISNGFTGRLLPEIILSKPVILKKSLDRQIKPSFDVLKLLLGNDSSDKLVATVMRCLRLSWIDLKSAMQRNFDFLVMEGVPANRVANLIMSKPTVMLHRPDRVVREVNALKNLGLEPNALMFTLALTAKIRMPESTWNKKIETMKSFGLTEEEIFLAFKQCPNMFWRTEKAIRCTMEFFVHTMKLTPQTVIANPLCLCYSLNQRIRPRCDVLKVLESKKLIKMDMPTEWLSTIAEENFLENFVTKYVDKVPDLLEIYGSANKAKKSYP